MNYDNGVKPLMNGWMLSLKLIKNEIYFLYSASDGVILYKVNDAVELVKQFLLFTDIGSRTINKIMGNGDIVSLAEYSGKKGYDYGGVTIHKLAEKFDEGDIVLQKRFSITPAENDQAIYAKCDVLAMSMTKEVLGAFAYYWENATEQQGGSYWAKPKTADYTVSAELKITQSRTRI